MTDLATLVVKLEAETSKYVAQLDQATQKLNKFKDDVGESIVEIGKKVIEAYAVEQIIEFTNATIESFSSLEKLSNETNIAASSLSKLTGAAKITNVDDFSESLTRLARSVGVASEGGQQMQSVFNALGVKIHDSSGNIKPTEEILDEVADSFSKYNDGVGKASAAEQLFGRSGADMITFLDRGRAGIQDLEKEVDSYGATVSDTAAKSGYDFESQLQRLELGFHGITNAIVVDMLPALSSSAQGFETFLKETSTIHSNVSLVGVAIKALSTAVLTIIYAVEQVWSDISNIFNDAGTKIGAQLAAINALIHGNVGQYKTIIAQANADVAKSYETYHLQGLQREQAYEDALGKIWSNTADNATALSKKISGKKDLDLPATSAIRALNTALGAMKQQASSIDISDGLKKTNVEAASTAITVGRLALNIQLAGKAGQEFIPQYLAAAKALDDVQAKAGVAKMTADVQKQIDTFGKSKSEIDAYELSTGLLGKQLAGLGPQAQQAVEKFLALDKQLEDLQNKDAITKISDQISTAAGNTAKAAADSFDLQNRALSSSLKNTGNTAGQQQLATLKALTVAQAQYNDLQTKASDIQSDLNNKITDIQAAQSKGQITDLESMKEQDEARNAAVVSLGDINARMQTVAASVNDPALKEGAKNFAESIKGIQNQTDQLAVTLKTDVTNAAVSAFDSFLEGTKSASDALKDFLKSFLDQLIDLESKQVFQTLFSGSAFGGSGSGGGFFGTLAGLFVGGTAHAGGGDVSAGMPYMVGENGPELMVPSTPGKVIPTGGMMSGIHFAPTYKVDARGATVDAIKLLPGAMKQAENNAIAQVLDLHRRGKL